MSAAQYAAKELPQKYNFFGISKHFAEKMLFLRAENDKTTMETKEVQEIVANYFKNQPVLKAWLFGSYARGEQTPLSDVDILVVLDPSQRVGLKFF